LKLCFCLCVYLHDSELPMSNAIGVNGSLKIVQTLHRLVNDAQ
jgi:hypothetical protein